MIWLIVYSYTFQNCDVCVSITNLILIKAYVVTFSVSIQYVIVDQLTVLAGQFKKCFRYHDVCMCNNFAFYSYVN